MRQADLIPLINQGMNRSEVRVIVVSYDDALGADFWPQCAVLSTHIPWSHGALEQLLGRANRVDPEGHRLVGWPKDATTKYAPSLQGLMDVLRSDFYSGK